MAFGGYMIPNDNSGLINQYDGVLSFEGQQILEEDIYQRDTK